MVAASTLSLSMKGVACKTKKSGYSKLIFNVRDHFCVCGPVNEGTVRVKGGAGRLDLLLMR